MSESSFKLTIAIPVYNEIKHISKTLEAVKSEIQTCETRIELLISDNASEDGSIELLEKCVSEMSHLTNLEVKLLKNRTNMGFNMNCDNLIAETKGEYFWILGAQEILLPGSLSQVLKILSTYPRQLVVNAEVWDEATDSLANPYIYGAREDAKYESAEEFFIAIGGPCRSISLNIVRTDAIKETLQIPTISHYWGMFERHAHACFIPNKNQDFLFVGKPLVRILIEESGWQATGVDDFGTRVLKNAFPGFYADLEMAQIALIFNSYGKEIKNAIGVWRDPFGVVRTISTAKCSGLKVNWKLLIKLTGTYKGTYWFWVLGLPLLLTPSKILNRTILEKLRMATHLLRRIFRKPAK
jgi:glycosyltransferase involved in cell wall biosynthesis